MVPQVLEAVLRVLKSAATLSFSMSTSGGVLRQNQAALRTRSSFSVKMDFSVVPDCCGLAGEEALMGEEDIFFGECLCGSGGRGLLVVLKRG
jgi:hypothetical protein